jgi:hypothetical protein
MKNFKGTQGEWTVAKWDGEQWPEKRWSVTSADGKAICICPRYAIEGEETEANAKLIAAAPDVTKSHQELQDLCRVLIKRLNLNMNNKQDKSLWDMYLEKMIQAEQAIEKALG